MDDSAALISAIRAHGEIRQINDGTPFVLVPAEYDVHSLESLLPRPGYTKKDVTVRDEKSFVAYVNRFGTSGTSVFANREELAVTAIIDYPSPDEPEHGAHRITLGPKLSKEWRRWSAIDGVFLPQAMFADFIEENVLDVREPDGATLLEVARLLEAAKSGAFRSGIRLDNGSFQLLYSEEITATAGQGKLEIPSKIKLGLPVFEGDAGYEVEAFFRYRITDGKLAISVKLHRADYVLEDAFTKMIETITGTITVGQTYFGPAPK